MNYSDLLRPPERTKVLVVDDHEDFLEGVTTYLEIAGYEVVASKSVHDATQKLQQHLGIQFVISDFDFGGGSKNGLYLHETLQQSKRNLPLLLITMRDDPEIVLHSIRKGVNGFMFKENCVEDILFAIDHIQNGNSYLCSHSNMILEKYHKSLKKTCITPNT